MMLRHDEGLNSRISAAHVNALKEVRLLSLTLTVKGHFPTDRIVIPQKQRLYGRLAPTALPAAQYCVSSTKSTGSPANLHDRHALPDADLEVEVVKDPHARPTRILERNVLKSYWPAVRWVDFDAPMWGNSWCAV